MCYRLDFYQDSNGATPVENWLDSLDEVKQVAALRSLSLILGTMGLETCNTEYGKPLGQGLYEFRLRHDANEVMRRAGRLDLAAHFGIAADERVLLRVFFHPYGDRRILLLGGYDKGADSGERRQQQEISWARRRLSDWRRREGQPEAQFRWWWIRKVRRLR